MGQTCIEKIISRHCGHQVRPGDIVDVKIDLRLARDFGGANIVQHLEENCLGIADPTRTFFTFDCNPGGSDQKYAANQQRCRQFARAHSIRVFDINSGIGTHIAIDNGLITPGGTLVSTDSHANLVGALGAFGQGMGDQDIAHAFAFGTVWFEVPRSCRITLGGEPGPYASAKDVVLALLKHFGADGLLDLSAELDGGWIARATLDQRITVASMATEMGAITLLFPPSSNLAECSGLASVKSARLSADPDATYEREVSVDIQDLEPLVSRPGHPEDVVPVSAVAGTKIDSAFIGSCTNGRFEDLQAAARILAGRHVAPGVVLKIVPATDAIWKQCLAAGLIAIFKEAGALVGNAGCAGCAAGQIGQNGPGEVTISTGNRNFPGKQGGGDVFLASPATVAASAIAGAITTADRIPSQPLVFVTAEHKPCPGTETQAVLPDRRQPSPRPTRVQGRVWVIRQDNIDTDMIYHNRYLSVTKRSEMGRYAFAHFGPGQDFVRAAKPGDIVVAGRNFGAGSSRQQAVDCFLALGIAAIVAESFGAIYKRNAINAGLPIIAAPLIHEEISDGDLIELDFTSGRITILGKGREVSGSAFSPVQMRIYQAGGLLKQRLVPGSQ
ncbi:MAG: aconitase/3-isopropylmalate dehydratase large subunit family protein [candidate division WOR-3 bacterium]